MTKKNTNIMLDSKKKVKYRAERKPVNEATSAGCFSGKSKAEAHYNGGPLDQANRAVKQVPITAVESLHLSNNNRLSATEREALNRAIDCDDEQDKRQSLREQSKMLIPEQQLLCLCFSNPGWKYDPLCPFHGGHAPVPERQFYKSGISTTSIQCPLGIGPDCTAEQFILTPHWTVEDYKLILLALFLAARLPVIRTNNTLLRKLQHAFNCLGEPIGLCIENIDLLAFSFPEPIVKVQGEITKQFKKAIQVLAELGNALRFATTGSNS